MFIKNKVNVNTQMTELKKKKKKTKKNVCSQSGVWNVALQK